MGAQMYKKSKNGFFILRFLLQIAAKNCYFVRSWKNQAEGCGHPCLPQNHIPVRF
jgi:hypothetical protein